MPGYSGVFASQAQPNCTNAVRNVLEAASNSDTLSGDKRQFQPEHQ